MEDFFVQECCVHGTDLENHGPTSILCDDPLPIEQGVRLANWVRELIIGIETVRDRRKPKYAINRTILDKNFHKQLILRMYWQRKAMKHL